MTQKSHLTPSDESLLETAGKGHVVEGRLFLGEDVVGANVAALQFKNCEFSDCAFEESVIRDSSFMACRFAKCRFQQARFVKTKFGGAEEADACTWSFCNLPAFEDCNLSMNKIAKSEVYLTSFSGCVAMGLLFEASVHKRVSNRLVLGGVKFNDCRLHYAAFEELDISKSEFVKCDLRDVSFRRSNLSDSSLTGSALSNADFSGATLDRATLAYSNFDSFNLADLLSYAGLIVSRDQVDTILGALGVMVVD
jgi:fluoroquinolone resistance protein